MRFQQGPMFRRVFVPWYDSDQACYISLIALLFSAVFGLAGVFQARSTPEHYQYLWIPLTVLILSVVLIISVAIRLYGRLFGR